MQVIIDHPYWATIYAVAFLRLAYAFLPNYTRGTWLKRGWGRVYVLQDIQFPYLFKVGFTTRTVGIRKLEIERDMTGGRPMLVIYWIRMPFIRTVEDVAHNRLRSRRHRCAGGTEFFKGNPRTMIRAVNRAARDVSWMARRKREWAREDAVTARQWESGKGEGRLF